MEYIAPDSIDERTVLTPGHHVGAVEVGDGLVLVDEFAAAGHALNPTATLVWRLLDGVSPLGDLIDDIASAYGIRRTDVSEQVIGLTRDLGSLGLFDQVSRSWRSVPVDIELVRHDDCGDGQAQAAEPLPELDDRYLAAPPNG